MIFSSIEIAHFIIFIIGRLNTNEDNENMLGYDLYSSALADILSEPSLSMPITVGLYAKWGSGKSFLLNKLRGELITFLVCRFTIYFNTKEENENDIMA